jgi:hypothetical protein
VRGDNSTREFLLSEVAGDLLSPTNAPDSNSATGHSYLIVTGRASKGLENLKYEISSRTEFAPACRREQANS